MEVAMNSTCVSYARGGHFRRAREAYLATLALSGFTAIRPVWSPLLNAKGVAQGRLWITSLLQRLVHSAQKAHTKMLQTVRAVNSAPMVLLPAQKVGRSAECVHQAPSSMTTSRSRDQLTLASLAQPGGIGLTHASRTMPRTNA